MDRLLIMIPIFSILLPASALSTCGIMFETSLSIFEQLAIQSRAQYYCACADVSCYYEESKRKQVAGRRNLRSIVIPSSNNITVTESPFSPAVTQDHQKSIGDTQIIGNDTFFCILQKSREQEMRIMQSLNVAKLGDLQTSINATAKLHMMLEQCKSHQKQLIYLILA